MRSTGSTSSAAGRSGALLPLAASILSLSPAQPVPCGAAVIRSEEHTSELQSLMRISYAVFCLQKKNPNHKYHTTHYHTIHKQALNTQPSNDIQTPSPPATREFSPPPQQ